MGQIRQFREADAAQCCSIILACLPQLDGLNEEARNFLRSKLIPERLPAELAGTYAVVYEEDGVVRGLAALDGEEAKRLYVDPGSQRRGIGRQLFQHIESTARSGGIAVLRGEASPSASPFYEKLGFTVDGPTEMFRGEARFSMLLISKVLDAPANH